jgi:hypothetical protein
MDHNDILLDLEDRLCDLEFQAFKDRWNKQQVLTTRKTNTGSTTQTEPAKKDWTLHFHKKADGSQEYRMQSAAGTWTTLPAERSLWPKEVRETHELFETYDKQRRMGGRSTAVARGTCEYR